MIIISKTLIFNGILNILHAAFAKRYFICKMPQPKKRKPLQKTLEKRQAQYQSAKALLDAGKMKSVAQLLTVVNKTPFSKEVGTTPERIDRIMADFSIASLGDFYRMSRVLDVDETVLMHLFLNDYVKQRGPEK